MENIAADMELQEEISVYARISVDTEKESDENTSIENQLKIIHNYIKQHFPKCTVKEYIDRDKSGYTFEQRENYMTMRKKLLDGTSKILIVKDFSRFSRRTSLGLWELEQMRDKDVRIISIMDGVDYPKNDDWLVISFRFMTNELPITDTSKKVRKSITVLQQEGEWLCAVPYGYIIVNQKKGIIDTVPDEAEVIKEIYRLYADEGWGYKKISNYLTDKSIPTPRMKEKQRAEEADKDFNRKVKKEWSAVSIQGILSNDYYIGTFRGHKYTRKAINGKDNRVDEAEHIVIQKHHKSIIDDKTFLYTQELLKKRTTSHYRGVKKYDTPYTGYLFCGDCGQPMFSRSRPDLAPSYICGTYHKRGLKACSSHHTRTDFLDNILKDYVRLIKINSQDMIKELESTVATEADSVKESEKVIKLLETQLANAKEELKATKKQKIRELARSQDDAELVEETYAEIEEEITHRIHGIQEQLKINISKRCEVVEIARAAKTVFDVFDGILKKDKLDKVDISLIVDKIKVYEDNTVDVYLKADVEQLLKTGTLPTEEKAVNFNFDSISISFNAQYAQKVKHQRAKAYTVNVVNEGDPLEIYTDREGEVIFKKYSPIGELNSFAAQYAETLHKTCDMAVIICDRDVIIACAGLPKKEYYEKSFSSELENIIENRTFYHYSEGAERIPVTGDGESSHYVSCAMPIISEGDIIGCVASIITENVEKVDADAESKLIQTAATFLGKQLDA